MTTQPGVELSIAGRCGVERRRCEEPTELIKHCYDVHVFVGVDAADHPQHDGLVGNFLICHRVVPPVLLKVEAASNSREGGQDREWAWSHRRLFGHTFATGCLP
jgi:hypothetical protein